MEADFLKLAYIAEFAIVFNLAFGEFKTNAIDLIVNESINKLRKISETILTVGASASSPSKTHDTTINRFGKFTAAVNGMHGIAPLDTNSAVIKNFRNRFRVFCTDTKKLEEKISTFRVFFQYLKYFPRAALATWVYSKTSSWTFKSCGLALIIWPLILIAMLAISIIFKFYLLYALLGISFSLLALRPLTALAAKLIRRKPYPRGRYYAFIQVMLIVLVLISSTLLDALKIKDANLWWFYFGFLISAALHPILMFVGYHALEVSIQDISNWADILNEETSKTRDEALDEIKTASEKMFISQTNPSTPPPN